MISLHQLEPGSRSRAEPVKLTIRLESPLGSSRAGSFASLAPANSEDESPAAVCAVLAKTTGNGRVVKASRPAASPYRETTKEVLQAFPCLPTGPSGRPRPSSAELAAQKTESVEDAPHAEAESVKRDAME
ncbi:hypothetical protein FN846DRAFT_892481 [Sphaerosporella brunnea]|uniref:Uncharacterized protein n=1 Tax=Sphaerosporella brunnea TaxID=1250544 RepID=A0A5J5EPS3_9PEZI|nr:hypothetical protein FN846DRAFT_892481 [Sphaerosporella brunnea]